MKAFDGLGKALRWLRAREDRRQYQVAEESGVTKAMLSAYETGKQKPSLETLEKILHGLGASLGDLHQALQLVRGQSDPFQVETGMAGPPGEADDVGHLDLQRILGVTEPLAPEDDRAYRRMILGYFADLRLRYHDQRKIRGTSAPEPASGENGSGGEASGGD